MVTKTRRSKKPVMQFTYNISHMFCKGALKYRQDGQTRRHGNTVFELIIFIIARFSAAPCTF